MGLGYSDQPDIFGNKPELDYHNGFQRAVAGHELNNHADWDCLPSDRSILSHHEL